MLSYNEIVLSPSYSEIRSRKKIPTSVNFLGWVFNSAAIPSNMVCTMSFDMARKLSESYHFYIMHRFCPYNDIYNFVKNGQEMRCLSISVGVQEEDKNLLRKIADEKLNVNFITIDVAHGHHILVKEMIEFINDVFGDHIRQPHIIAGNVGTPEAVNSLVDWGVDAVKVGIAMGKACTTYNCTGVGTPMFTAVQQAATSFKVKRKIPVIADGQVREVGDVCKALVAGANLVMIGSEFAKCKDSPAEIVQILENTTTGIHTMYKEFFGSASKFNKGNDTYIEGQKVLLPMREETYIDYLNRINEGVSSCMSYAGVEYISDLTTMEYSEIYPRN